MKKFWLIGGFENVLFQLRAFNVITVNYRKVDSSWAIKFSYPYEEIIIPEFFRNNLGIYVKTKKLTIV